MAAQWPLVQQRLVALLPTLDGYDDVTVHDGAAVTEQGAKSYVTVGATTESGAGSYTQTPGAVTALREESGTVLLEVVVWAGDSITTNRTSAFALVDALEASVRADQTLDVLPAGSTVDLSVDVQPLQDSSGSTQRLIVSVNYFSRS